MEFKYCKDENFEDFASGRVLYNAFGVPNFPVRLANEIFRRCLQYSNKKQGICLYDCCCGGGYSLTVLGLLNQQSVSEIYASDIDDKMIDIANRNLSLLSKSGIQNRINEIQSLYEQYHKESHKDAVESAMNLLNLMKKEIDVHIFQANALQKIPIVISPDIIITDVPYGNLVDWKEGTDGIGCLLDILYEICSPETIIAICMDKNQKVNNYHFRRLERQNIGKRRYEILKLAL